MRQYNEDRISYIIRLEAEYQTAKWIKEHPGEFRHVVWSVFDREYELEHGPQIGLS